MIERKCIILFQGQIGKQPTPQKVDRESNAHLYSQGSNLLGEIGRNIELGFPSHKDYCKNKGPTQEQFKNNQI